MAPRRITRRNALGLLATGTAGAAALHATPLGALAQQWERRSAMYPLPGPYRDRLRKNYPVVYRYLNVVDIGHAELAEALIVHRGNEARTVPMLEQDTFARVTGMFLDWRTAPRLAVHEETVAPESVKVAPRLNQAFDWTHILHRQIYDILASDLPMDRKKQFIRESYNWYWSEPRRAFPGRLKTHDLMEHQWFSQYWREKYPKFNAAIWAYHWYQLRLNEVMLEADPSRRDAAVDEATAEFRAMFQDNALLPKHMPMAHTIAPRFLAEFPEISFTFDNLHAFHDIYNDILAHPKITDKRDAVYTQLDDFLNPATLLESAPMHPLPPDLPSEDHRRLNQLTHMEHMAMMIMPVAEQMQFFRQAPEQRTQVTEHLRAEMIKHWPNFEKKHAEMEHRHHDDP